MTPRIYVTIQGGHKARLEPRYTFAHTPKGYQKRYYVTLLGADEPAEFPVAEHHILRRLTVIKGGKS